MSGRRANDYYPTTSWATDLLLENVDISGVVFEPCVGQGHIANVLKKTNDRVVTNDLDLHVKADMYWDARHMPYRWPREVDRPAWIVSNPPFLIADELIPICVDFATEGVAMLLRLSVWEPTLARGMWLEENPPTTFLSLPRISFTGDGKTDNVSTGWFVWEKNVVTTLSRYQRMVVIPKKAGHAWVPLAGMRT